MADPAAAILLFQVAQSRNFIHDDLIPALSAALTARGVRNELFETTLPAIDAADAADLSAVDALIARLRDRYTVCAYVRLWSEAVFQHLRAQLPGFTWIYLGDPRVAFAGTTHAFPLNQVETFAAVTRAVAAGEPVTAAMFRLPAMELTRAHARDNLVRIGVGRDPRPDRPAVVHGSAGCAYGQSILDNPHFRDVPFPDARVVLRGCSFCASGGVPRRPAGEVLASVLAQLDHLLDHAPGTARIQLNDQNPFPYLVPFIDRLGERAAHPMEVLIETRADWFLGSMAVMERALQGAERHGHRILLFLVGLESLSQKDLDLYNKGVTVEQNERTVLECRRLRRRYPGSYSDTPAAFGFILYNPWTELSDITLNLDAAERVGLKEFRGQLTRAKLRLYPDTALYYKARHEGLLAERFPYEAMDSARRYGYEAEVPWRFKHLATDRAYGVHDAIFRAVGKHEEGRMLREIVRFLDRRPDRWSEPVPALARDVVRSLGSRFQREIRHSAPGAGPPRAPSTPSRPSPGVAPPSVADREAWQRVGDAARAARTPAEALRAVGLEPPDDLPDAPPAVPADPLRGTVPRLEILAYEHGLKPALYLTLPRAEAEAMARRFGDHPMTRVDYRFEHDAVTDVRRRSPAPPGEGTHVDLFIARAPDVVARARAIYEDPRGPSEHLAEMGAILGYPPCCVEAFAALPDRSNNTAIRYAALARTARLGLPFAPVLNNLFAYVLPSFPCSYGCARAIAQAEAVLALLGETQPEAAARLRLALARPVLFVDHARLVVLTAARVDGDVVRHGGVVGGVSPTDDLAVRDRFEQAMGAVLARGDGLRVTDGALEVLRGGERAAWLPRRSPGLGVLAPFGL